jgi:hypothetical protein
VAQLSTYKYQVAVCVELEGKLYSGDWTQAYLNAINTAEQYMRVPDGIRRRYNADGTQQVLRLAKALYGGKGSAGLWDMCADTWHCEFGFTRCNSDPRLYTCKDGAALIAVVICTDDTSTMVPDEKYYPGSQALYEKYQAALKTDFKRENGTDGYTNKGLLTEFIGIRTTQNNDGSIDIDMNGYKDDLIKRHGFLDSHRASAPAKPGVILSELDLATPDTKNPPDVTKYRSRIGGTMWLSRGGLPIVGYQVAALARFNHAPGKKHWDASSDMMRFIATSVDARVCFKRTGKPLFYYGQRLPTKLRHFFRQQTVDDRVLLVLGWCMCCSLQSASNHDCY